jgi:hypothetical protein
VATALLERGHTPIAYSRRLGPVADELRQATIPVIQDLHALGSPPDIIHGHHHLETMTALLHFPGVPAVFFCHGWLPWQEQPLRFPRIMAYVAVDHTCRDRLVCEGGIPAERVHVVLNFVDLRRFQPRAALPSRPRRALLFSNCAREDNIIPAVRAACALAHLELDIIGAESGHGCSRPEEVLGQYDVVFAKARAALEALATGNAVVLCDTVGAGPLVTLAELDRLRCLNFGIRALDRRATPENLGREIERYDAGDAAEVTRRIRASASRDAAVDEIIALYHECITRAARHDRQLCLEAEGRAAAAYLGDCHPLFERVCLEPVRQECARAHSECDRLRGVIQAQADQRETQERERQGLESAVQQLRTHAAALRSEHDARTVELVRSQETCLAVVQDDCQRLRSADDRLRAIIREQVDTTNGLRTESDNLHRALQELRVECDALRSADDRLRAIIREQADATNALRSESDNLHRALQELGVERDALGSDCSRLRSAIHEQAGTANALQVESQRLRLALRQLGAEHDALQNDRDQLAAACKHWQHALERVHDSITLRLRARLVRLPGLKRLARLVRRGVQLAAQASWRRKPVPMAPAGHQDQASLGTGGTDARATPQAA